MSIRGFACLDLYRSRFAAFVLIGAISVAVCIIFCYHGKEPIVDHGPDKIEVLSEHVEDLEGRVDTIERVMEKH